ncbi:hypothetical protein GCM10027589_04320 [Actinocorallia lasiicapitis]
MTAQPVEPRVDVVADHDVIQRDGQAVAVVVPIEEYRRLHALAANATPEDLENAEMDAHHAEYQEWKAAGMPGAMSHEEFMAELFGDDAP